jgi:hypothetical protein
MKKIWVVMLKMNKKKRRTTERKSGITITTLAKTIKCNTSSRENKLVSMANK